LKKSIDFISEQLFSQEISSVKKLKRWDNLISILSFPQSINIQLFWQQWLEKEVPASYFISLESESEIWLTFRNVITKYISEQSPILPSWLQDTFDQHLEKINQQLNDSSSDIISDSNFNTVDKTPNNFQNLSNNQVENNTNNSSNLFEYSTDNFTINNENKHQEFPKIFSEQNEKVYFVNNSGLVLLFPYLSRYLEALNYVKNNQFISFNHQLQAVHPLEHLVRGEEDYREYDLVLNKILLGLPLETPLNPELGKLCFQSQEVTELLESAINHWQILGKTSVDGFRQSFLKREGKLIEAENHWKLIVNRKGYDVLLSKLPYPLYVVKLSWMNQPLYIEW
jgi:hypothetical protein